MTKPIEGADYFVYFASFSGGVGGVVTPNDDGTFSVYLNANASWEKQVSAMDHELKHIVREDFYNGKPIEEIENN